MTNTFYKKNKSELLLEMTDIQIDGFADNRWHKIIKGMNLKLNKGEVLGLIGESGADPEFEAQIRKRLGLDKTVFQQLILYLKGILSGDLGKSFVMNENVSKIIWRNFGQKNDCISSFFAAQSSVNATCKCNCKIIKQNWSCCNV